MAQTLGGKSLQTFTSNCTMKSEFPGTKHRWSHRTWTKILPALHLDITKLAEAPSQYLLPPAARGKTLSVLKRRVSASPATLAGGVRGRGAGMHGIWRALLNGKFRIAFPRGFLPPQTSLTESPELRMHGGILAWRRENKKPELG